MTMHNASESATTAKAECKFSRYISMHIDMTHAHIKTEDPAATRDGNRRGQVN
ncbi:MAG: hypothetical protein HOL32_09355 [Octadecabacter sp.]|nr:hypothetical protein [Octadecabacter sp.]